MTRRRTTIRRRPAIAALLFLGATASEARADNAAAADALFVEGRNLLQQQKYDQACPKLAESHRLDPATGTLLALALCLEGQGKVASAWAAYRDVQARAQNEKNTERAKAAAEREAALEPKLPRLLVEVSPAAPAPAGLEIRRDGELVGAGSLGTAIPVDPGEHTITATAPGKAPFTTKVRAVESATARVVVGPLAGAAPLDPAPAAPGFFTPLRTVGIVTGAAGVAGLVVAGALAGVAVSKKAESDKDCEGNVCGPAGLPLRQEARSFGDGATVSLVAGGVLAAAGVTLVIAGGPGSSSDEKRATSADRSRAAVTPVVAPGAAGLVLRGAF